MDRRHPIRDPFALSAAERLFIERARLLDARRRHTLACAACGAKSAEGAAWQAHLTKDERPELRIYCPDCAQAR
jgi:hypothetical protein